MACTPTLWAVTALAHPALREVREDCPVCLALADEAIALARVTGSVGATVRHVALARTNDETVHSVTVARAVDVLTR